MNSDDLIAVDATVLTVVLAAPAIVELVKVLRTWVEGLNEQRRKTLRIKIDDMEMEVSNISEATLVQLEKRLLERAKKK